ncbi:SPOR domain-containing protein [Novosphingobium sp. ZN18A2]|uniref:SPOR domain-containing protein n=1 Tax=Novosphingobium sp. ZN18A2 TaxID=3079861 RepID=UPI0030CE5BDE
MTATARSIGLRLTALALAAAVAVPASASIKDGVDDWTRGDYKGAVAQWQGPAATGDADAQFNLAQAYKLGRGVPQDMDRAEALYRKAAQQGHMRAADSYGLLLFERGRREQAMPWIKAAASRGEPRAQYVMGIAHFNGDLASKDWVRAYALMTRAAGSGLPQAVNSLHRMDTIIPIEQRQQGIALAARLDQQAREARETQLAAADLGTARPAPVEDASASDAAPLRATPPPSRIAKVAVPPSAAGTANGETARTALTAGADYADPVTLPSREFRTADAIRVHKGAAPPHAAPAHMTEPKAQPAQSAQPARPASRPDRDGPWRIQLGAFGNAGNADALWREVSGRAEMAGLSRFDVPAGRITRLQAGGFASEAEAARACGRLKAAGLACLAIKR